MTPTETIKACVTPDLVREIFGGHIIDEGRKGWYITVCGKVVTINGRVFYDRRDQAVAALRNSYSWKARRRIHHALHPNDSEWAWWRSEDATRYWTVFKKTLEEDYGLKILHA